MTDTINLLIDGKAVAATGGRVFERRNPLDCSVASRADTRSATVWTAASPFIVSPSRRRWRSASSSARTASVTRARACVAVRACTGGNSRI